MSGDSDEDDDHVCPLCVEEVDVSDRDFLPCPCGYRVSCLCCVLFISYCCSYVFVYIAL